MGIIDYIFEQPHVLKKITQELPPILASMPKLIGAENFFFIGAGTSYNALTAMEPLWIDMICPFIKTSTPLNFISSQKTISPHTTALILSQTGTSKTTIQAAEHAQKLKMRVITLTADPASPISRVSPEKIIIPVGPETVGPKTKGYTASIMTLLLLILAQRDKFFDFSKFIGELSSFIQHSSDVAKTLVGTLDSANFVLIMGQRRHFATALESSLKLTEMSGLSAAVFDTEEAFHGRFHGLHHQSLAFFICSSAQEYELALIGMEVLKGLGISGYIINLSRQNPTYFDFPISWPNSNSLPELDLISAIIPFQFLAYYLAKQRNIIPETMRYPGLSRKLQIKAT